MPHPRFTRLLLVVAAWLGGLTACNDGGTSPESSLRGIRVLDGEGGTDTIGARQLQPLVVEVRDGRGRVRPGARVVFAGLSRAGVPAGDFQATMLLRDTLLRTGSLNSAITDSRGRAQLWVSYGRHAGEGRVEVGVLEPGTFAPSERDTARYTVLAGAPASVVIEPADTVVMVGGIARFRGSVRDRNDNPRTEALAWSALSGAVTIAGSGDASVSAQGFARVRATYGAYADTAIVVGAPVGTLSGFVAPFNGPVSLVLFDVDGMRRRTVLQRADGSLGTREWVQEWSMATPTMFFQVGERIFALDASGALRPLFADSVPRTQYRPTVSRDGQWVYFYGLRALFADVELWRARPDGSGLEALATGRTGTDGDIHPAPSPDGTRLAFVSYRAGSSIASIYVLQLATGQVTPLGIPGFLPRWSPSGDRIAYFAAATDELRIVNADGTGDRSLVRSLGSQFSWSPDGHWIVGRGEYPAVMLIEVATGERALVPGTQGVSSPAWMR